MSLATADYDFHLPDELIARHPAPQRDGARMLVLDRKRQTIEHRIVREFVDFVGPGDLVLLNNTRVIPARLHSDDGVIEIFLLEALSERRWKCFVKPGRKMRVGDRTEVRGVKVEVLEVLESGERVVEFAEVLDLNSAGEVPLPPYIDRAPSAEDRERYQTVYASQPGAVAAPTAGLHFTPEMLARIPHAFLTLHVGAGTFKPVSVEKITDHPMHTEVFDLPGPTVEVARKADRIVAIGTTTVRVLEHCMRAHGELRPGPGSTNIFIYPPYRFGATGAMLTNFHLPKSTLLMLVSAFAGRDFILEAYRQAVAEKYRFYSYGDCMLIL